MTRPNSATATPPDPLTGTASTVLLPGEIAGATTVLHHMASGAVLPLAGDPRELHILLAVAGSGRIDYDGHSTDLAPKATFAALPGDALTLTATQDLSLLQIIWQMSADEADRLAAESHRFPVHQDYAPASQYRDYFKSEQTISRTLIGPNVLPRFCMGSVESFGPDHIQPHAHPMLDQLFFSFADNDITLLIDGQRHPLGGSTLLHIPLGSDHGVDVTDGCHMHYVWMDFFKEDKDMSYIVEVHTDVPSRSFSADKHRHPPRWDPWPAGDDIDLRRSRACRAFGREFRDPGRAATLDCSCRSSRRAHDHIQCRRPSRTLSSD